MQDRGFGANFPRLQFIGIPSTTDGEQYYLATWTGISGDRFYRNAPGADFTTFTDAWVNDNIRSKGPLGKHYPFPCCIHEGDTPSFLGLDQQRARQLHEPDLRRVGRTLCLAHLLRRVAAVVDAGWRFVSRPRQLEGHGHRHRRPGHTTDQATIWRWRTAFQHDFAARMDWTVKAPATPTTTLSSS